MRRVSNSLSYGSRVNRVHCSTTARDTSPTLAMMRSASASANRAENRAANLSACHRSTSRRYARRVATKRFFVLNASVSGSVSSSAISASATAESMPFVDGGQGTSSYEIARVESSSSRKRQPTRFVPRPAARAARAARLLEIASSNPARRRESSPAHRGDGEPRPAPRRAAPSPPRAPPRAAPPRAPTAPRIRKTRQNQRRPGARVDRRRARVVASARASEPAGLVRRRAFASSDRLRGCRIRAFVPLVSRLRSATDRSSVSAADSNAPDIAADAPRNAFAKLVPSRSTPSLAETLSF